MANSKRINVTVKEELYNDVKEYCDNLGISVSAFVAISMKDRMDSEKMLKALGQEALIKKVGGIN